MVVKIIYGFSWSESETYCDKPAKSKSLTIVKTCEDNSAGHSNIEANLDGDIVPLCGRRLFCVKHTLTQ